MIRLDNTKKAIKKVKIKTLKPGDIFNYWGIASEKECILMIVTSGDYLRSLFDTPQVWAVNLETGGLSCFSGDCTTIFTQATFTVLNPD